MDSVYLAEKQELFRKRLAEEGVFIEGKLLQGSQTPYLMPVEKYEKLAAGCELISSCLEKFLRVYVDSKEVQDLFPELEKYRELTCFRPASKHWIHYSRFDLIESENGEFKILDTYTASPIFMASTYCSRIYEELGLLPNFLQPGMEVVKQPMDDPECMARSLVELSKEVLGKDSPNIAIFTSRQNSEKADGSLIEKATKGMGLNCVLTNIQELSMGVDGKIYAGKMPIDVAFQKVDKAFNPEVKPTCFADDVAEDDAKIYLQGLRDGKFVIANNFVSCLVAESKKILAMLKRREFQKHFTEEEQEAIRELVPETYVFDHTNQDTFLERVDDFIKNKPGWVINAFGPKGKYAYPGNLMPVVTWKELVMNLRGGPNVIQKFISGARTPVYNDADQPELKLVNLVVSLHILRGKASGIAVKLGKYSALNFKTGDVMPPAYVVSSRAMVD